MLRCHVRRIHECSALPGETPPAEPSLPLTLQGAMPPGSPPGASATSPRRACPPEAPQLSPHLPRSLTPNSPAPPHLRPSHPGPEPHPPQEASHKLMTFVRPLRQMETFFHFGMCCTRLLSEALAHVISFSNRNLCSGKVGKRLGTRAFPYSITTPCMCICCFSGFV